MKLKIILDIFSGLPNPELIVSGSQAKNILDLIVPEGRAKKITSRTIQVPTGLGYRGIIVEQLDKASSQHPIRMHLTDTEIFAGETLYEFDGDLVEAFVVDRFPRFTNFPSGSDLPRILKSEIRRFRKHRIRIPKKIPKWPSYKNKPCFCAPEPELDWWNDGQPIQNSNNCYNYATNYRTNTIAQPGRASGHELTSVSGCSVAAGQVSAKQGALDDQLIDLPNADNKCPKQGHLVALVIWPNSDYHWMRKGPSGHWSHKPGTTPAIDHDNSNNLITDPRTANRGPYTQFCTFMQVIHGHIKIG